MYLLSANQQLISPLKSDTTPSAAKQDAEVAKQDAIKFSTPLANAGDDSEDDNE